MLSGHTEIKTYALTGQNDDPVEFILKDVAALYDEMEGRPDKPHRHDYYTIILLEKAKGRHNIDFRTYELFDHSLFFVYPGQVHQVIASERPTGWVLNFSKLFLVKNHIPDKMVDDVYLFNEHGETPPLPLNAEQFDYFKTLVSHISDYTQQQIEYKSDALGALLKLLLIQSNNHCSLQKTDDLQSLETGNQLVRNFKQLIEKHFRVSHKVSDYAGMLSVTSDYLNKSVKTLTGKSAKEYILHRIILEAKRSLLFTELSNKELAYFLGFEEPAHFSNFFKRYSGLSPLDFRNSARQN
ncbi:helix-turn-helix domain-containing protein [Saccharicrinis sp. FJH54]|uniref:helix-turn-helix domain-containing protein n=1 Tax=Saccharicrinis sp. FJH54 TaxID=3344665 RepID=UPI0035D448BD